MTKQKHANNNFSMTDITVVEFESATFGNNYISELSDGPPYQVHGIALGADDVTVGSSGVKKMWPAEELEKAADTLRGTNLVVDHNNDADGVVGRVTKSGYKEGTGVVYEAELYDEDLAEKVKSGLLEVSIRGYHADISSLEEDDDTGAKVVENIEFDNLSIVPTGAAPSNTLEMGAHAELSAAELSAFTDTLEAAELQEVEPGMWVKFNGNYGVTISQVEDGEIEVDLYEEDNGTWRSIEQTEMVSVDDISEWDVDEDNIGSAMKSDEEEMVATDDKVSWDSSGGMAQGIVRKRKTEGCFNEEIDGDQEICADEDNAVVLIEIVKDGEATGTMVAHKEKTVSSADFEMGGAPEFSDGQMVQWQVEPTMFGKVVHVPEDDDIVMVNVHEMEDGEPVSTGFTVTAGYSDLMPMKGSSPEQRSEDEMEELETFSDYPDAAKENAQMALDAKEETGNPNDCGTQTGWNRASQLASGEAVSEEVVGKMSAFNRHRKNSDMDDDEGKADCGWMMWKAWGGDEGVDWASRKMESLESDELSLDNVKDEHKFNSETDALDFIKDMDEFEGVHKMGSFWVPGNTHEDYMNFIDEDYSDEEETEDPVDEGESDESDAGEELQEYEMSTPDWSGTTTSDWSSPDMEDFDTDDLSEIENHFLISATGFPPENYTDLKLPVVEPSGELNVNALAAVKGGRGVSAVDGLSDEMEEEIVDWVNSTASEEFDKDWGNEEEAEDAKAHEIDGTAGRPTPSKTVGGVRVLSSDDLRQSRKSEESDVDSLTTYKVDKMTDIEEKLAELENPVAVEADEVDELRNKADRFEEMSENLEAVRERTDILDEVDRSQVEELAESDDAVVVESARYDELQDEAKQVKGVYAASLAEEYPAFNAEELSDKFSIEELREKFEEQIGDVEEELTSSADAEPQSQDPSEDELEDASGEGAEEEELSAEVEEKQEAIKNKILGGN